jgi:hypothetical protein
MAVEDSHGLPERDGEDAENAPRESSPQEPDLPPSYEQAQQDQQAEQLAETIPSSIPSLDPKDPGPATTSTVSRDQCIVHLKLLAAFADLRDSIASNDGLFGIYDRQADQFTLEEENKVRALARIKEKRWAVYTARAVDRYTAWWEKCVVTRGDPPTVDGLSDPSYVKITRPGYRILWARDKMPPLGECDYFVFESFFPFSS